MPRPTPDIADSHESMAYSVAQAATAQRHNDRLTSIVVMMSSAANVSSTIARYVSKHRPHVPVICMVPSHKEGRLLQIYKGLHPVLMLQEVDRAQPSQVLQHLRKLGMVKAGDQSLVVRQHADSSDVAIELSTV